MVTPEGKYQFKPPYDLRDRKTMLKLLRKHDLKGYGGLLLEDVQESLPNCDRIMKVTLQRRTGQGAGSESARDAARWRFDLMSVFGILHSSNCS